MARNFRSVYQPFSSQINVDGKTYLYFGGTAYLGIPQNQDFISLYFDGIKKFGLNNGTSRNNNVQLGIYDEAEKVAATRFGAEDALITSSGYLAAQLTVKALSSLGQVIYAPATHPALWLNEPPLTPNTSFSAWINDTIERINSSAEKNWVLVSNSMNNLFPEVFDFDFIDQINPDKNIILIVDDSHGIGINNNGWGALPMIAKKTHIDVVVVASMAKALGVDAGIVLGSQSIIKDLKTTNIFLGASPPSAAALYAFIHAEDIYKTALNKLQNNILLLSKALGAEWTFVPGFPAFLINDTQIDQTLLEANILISSFPYPNKESKPINRIVLSSWHSESDIEQLVNALHNKKTHL